MSSSDKIHRTQPISNPVPFAIVLSTVYLIAYAVGHFLPENLWGVNLLRHLDLAHGVLVIVFGIVASAVILVGAEHLRLSRITGRVLLYLIAPGALLALFFYLSVATHYLGDGILRARELETGFVIQPTEPLAHLVNYLTYKLFGQAGGLSASQAIMAVSYASGLLFYYALLPLVSELSKDRATRVFYFLILYFSGTTLLFCGYAETYMLLPALIAVYIYTGIKAIRGKMSPLVPVVVLIVLVLFHFKSLIFAPSIFVLAYFAHKQGKRFVWPAVASAMLVIVLAIAFVPTISELPRVPLTEFVFGLSDKGENYPFFSLQHFADVYSELMLTGGVAVVLFLSLITLRLFRNSFKRPEVLYVAASSPGALGMLIFLYSELGFAVDWDLFSVVGLTLNLVTVVALAYSGTVRFGRIARIAVASVGVTSFLVYAAVNKDFNTMIDRHVELLELYGGNQAAIGFETLGNNLNREGYPEIAERMWQRSVRIRPHVRMYANLGQLALNRGQLTEAEYYLLKGMELDSTLYVLHTNLGLAYARMGEFERAKPYLERAIELSPRNASVYHNYAVALIQEREFRLAEEKEREALKLQPNVAMYLVAMGAALVGQERGDDAREYLHRALQIEPSNAQAISTLSNALGVSGRHQEAIQVIENYLQQHPNSQYAPHLHQKAANIRAYMDSIRTEN